jgi:hypothetical protein
MTEGCIYICVNLSISLLPTTTEGVVLTEIPTISWINHTVEAGVIVIKVPILVIIFAPQFWELILEGFEHRALDDHKTRGSI